MTCASDHISNDSSQPSKESLDIVMCVSNKQEYHRDHISTISSTIAFHVVVVRTLFQLNVGPRHAVVTLLATVEETHDWL